MLQTLRIANFAIVDSLSVEFDAGFNALTGETGAGKSILVDAIGLVLGGRASADWIRTGEDAATVEALFSLSDEAKKAAGEAGLEGDELLVKRVVSRSGKNKVFLNGGPATLAMLQALGPKLLAIAGQHEHQSLLAGDAQRAALDAAGGLEETVSRMATAHAAWASAKRDLEALAAKESDRARREDYLRFQVEELARAELAEGEEERLVAERSRLAHAESLAEAIGKSEDALYAEDGAVAARLKAVHGWLQGAARIDSTLAPLLARVESARVELEDVARELRDRREIGADPERLAEVEDRLVLLDRLRKKHGESSVAALLALQARLTQDLAELTGFDAALNARREVEAAARNDAESIAAKLSEARRKAAKGLSAKVAEEVRALGMPHTRFEIALERGELTAAGWDSVEFRIAPNPGEELKALAKTASGGELSRVMLALKVVMTGGAGGRKPPAEPPKAASANAGVPSYVFDEVDAGVGGAIAERVGRKLSEVAGEHQVLVVTHLPQVASLAGAHFRVKKSVSGGRTSTTVERLDAAGREEEVARMLGGLEITAATRAHAREMLSRRAARPRRAARVSS